MLPYFLVYPIWVLVAIVWPAIMSLHAVRTKEEQNVWLGYWVLYAAMTVSYPLLDHIMWAVCKTVFYIVGDVYYELQVFVVAALVNPKMRQLDKVLAIGTGLWDQHGETVTSVVTEKCELAKDILSGLMDKAPAHKIE